MPSTLPNQRTDQQLTSGQYQVGLPLLKTARPSEQAVDLALGDWVLPIVKRAQELTIKQGAAVRVLGIPKTQYIENLQGKGHLSIRRLALLDENFWLAFIDGLREHFKVDNDADRLARALAAREACDKVIEEIARKSVGGR